MRKSILIIREPKNWLEKQIWHRPKLWKVYEILNVEKLSIEIRPDFLTKNSLIKIAMNIRLIEEKLGEINPDILSIMLAQNPRSVMEIIKVFIPRSERETTIAWIERNAKSKDLADAFYFCREHALNSIQGRITEKDNGSRSQKRWIKLEGWYRYFRLGKGC